MKVPCIKSALSQGDLYQRQGVDQSDLYQRQGLRLSVSITGKGRPGLGLKWLASKARLGCYLYQWQGLPGLVNEVVICQRWIWAGPGSALWEQTRDGWKNGYKDIVNASKAKLVSLWLTTFLEWLPRLARVARPKFYNRLYIPLWEPSPLVGMSQSYITKYLYL